MGKWQSSDSAVYTLFMHASQRMLYQKVFTVTNSMSHLLDFTGSVGKSADSAFLSASVDDPDDAFVGFTYVPPTDLTEWKR